MRYEYHIIHWSDEQLTSNKGADAIAALTPLGYVGWDIAATLTLGDGTHIILMRRVSE